MASRDTVIDALGAGYGGPHWLLELDCAGRVYRAADLQVEIDDTMYEAGLTPPTIAETGDLLDSVSVELDLGVDWARLIADGSIVLELARATLRRWWPGQDLRAAELVLAGEVVEPEWGSADEPLTITIQRETSTGWMLEAQAVADATTWPTDHLRTGPLTPYDVHQTAVGQHYPVIFGYPGGVSAWYGEVGVATTPALLVSVLFNSATTPPSPYDNSYLLIAGHRVEASDVWVWSYSGDERGSELRAVQHVEDALGRTVAVVDFVGSSLPNGAFYETPELWVGWAAGGGMLAADGTVLRGAYDVIEWVLRTRTTRRVDWARMSAARDHLNRYQVDTYVNGQALAWQWVEDELLRLLPVVVLEGEIGLYLKVVHWRATRSDAELHLDADARHVDRTSRLVSLRQEVENEIEVQFCFHREQWGERRWVSAKAGQLSTDASVTADSRVAHHDRCQVSQARYGVRPRSQPVELSWSWHRETAELVARDLADRYALPLRSVRYIGPWELDQVQAWDVVTITDSEVALDRAVALVSQVSRLEDGIELDLVLLPE